MNPEKKSKEFMIYHNLGKASPPLSPPHLAKIALHLSENIFMLGTVLKIYLYFEVILSGCVGSFGTELCNFPP